MFVVLFILCLIALVFGLLALAEDGTLGAGLLATAALAGLLRLAGYL